MIRAFVWGREVEMQGGPWAFVEYRREFGADLLSDVAAAYKRDPMMLDDFLRFGWALCRTADAGTPSFEEWCRSFPDFSVADGEGSAFASVVSSALEAEVFRARAPRLVRWRRALRARWLGWLSRRRRARQARLRGR